MGGFLLVAAASASGAVDSLAAPVDADVACAVDEDCVIVDGNTDYDCSTDRWWSVNRRAAARIQAFHEARRKREFDRITAMVPPLPKNATKEQTKKWVRAVTEAEVKEKMAKEKPYRTGAYCPEPRRAVCVRSFCAEVGNHDRVIVYDGIASRLVVEVAVEDAFAIYDAAARDLVADLDLDAALVAWEHMIVAVFGRADVAVVEAALAALAPPLTRRETLERNLLEKVIGAAVSVHELQPLRARAADDDGALRELARELLLLFAGDPVRERALLASLDAHFPGRRGGVSWRSFAWPKTPASSLPPLDQRTTGSPER